MTYPEQSNGSGTRTGLIIVGVIVLIVIIALIIWAVVVYSKPTYGGSGGGNGGSNGGGNGPYVKGKKDLYNNDSSNIINMMDDDDYDAAGQGASGYKPSLYEDTESYIDPNLGNTWWNKGKEEKQGPNVKDLVEKVAGEKEKKVEVIKKKLGGASGWTGSDDGGSDDGYDLDVREEKEIKKDISTSDSSSSDSSSSGSTTDTADSSNSYSSSSSSKGSGSGSNKRGKKHKKRR